MSAEFYKRLKDYYASIGSALRDEAAAASIFPNASDIGSSRERIYAEFLRTHLPASCTVLYGGFVFDQAGNESNQIDLIISSDSCPQFNFTNKNGSGKSFACIDGTVSVISLKSNLDSKELTNVLENIASIPLIEPLEGKRAPPILIIPSYHDWPFKVIYAPDGISMKNLMTSLDEFYMRNPLIPMARRPNLIHVAGKYCIVRILGDDAETLDGTRVPKDTFYGMADPRDIFALTYVVEEIQKISAAMHHILFDYDRIRINLLKEQN